MEIKPSGISVITEKLNKTTNDLMNIRAELSYNSQSFDIGGMWGPKFAHVIYNAFFIQRVGGSQPLAEARMQEGNIVLTTITERPSPNGYVEILVNGGFTALSEDGETTGIPSPYCCSGADVKVDVYIDGVLQPQNHRADAYDGFAVVNIIYPPPCGDGAPVCDGEQETPTLNPKEYLLEELFPTACTEKLIRAGQTRANIEDNSNFFENQELNICFNNGKWQYEIGNQNELQPKFGSGVCIDNILRLHEGKVISSLSRINEIPENELCQALSDFEAHKIYNNVKAGHYYIIDVVLEHEKVHGDKYIELYNNAFNKYKHAFLDLNLECDIDNYESVKNNYKVHLETVKDRIRSNFITYRNLYRSGNYEQKTQSDYKVKKIIKNYIDVIKARINTLENINCTTQGN